MREAEKTNVVQIRDYARRRAALAEADQAESRGPRGELLSWPRMIAPYPGGIDDLPV